MAAILTYNQSIRLVMSLFQPGHKFPVNYTVTNLADALYYMFLMPHATNLFHWWEGNVWCTEFGDYEFDGDTYAGTVNTATDNQVEAHIKKRLVSVGMEPKIPDVAILPSKQTLVGIYTSGANITNFDSLTNRQARSALAAGLSDIAFFPIGSVIVNADTGGSGSWGESPDLSDLADNIYNLGIPAYYEELRALMYAIYYKATADGCVITNLSAFLDTLDAI